MGVKWKDKSAESWRLARRKAFERREPRLIAVRAGHKSGCAAQIGYRYRRPAPWIVDMDTAHLGELE